MNQPGPISDKQRILDQHVLAIIRASGGWNAHARARLAHFAQSKRIDPGAVIASARRVGSMPAEPAGNAVGVGDAIAGDAAAQAAGAPTAFAPTPIFFNRTGSSSVVGLVVGVGFVVIGALLSGVLVWFALRQAAAPAVAPAGATLSPGATAPPGSAVLPGASGAAVDHAPELRPTLSDAEKRSAIPTAPETFGGATGTDLQPPDPAVPASSPKRTPAARDIPPAAAIYPRAPVLRADPAPAWARRGLETIASDESALDALAARLSGGDAATDADRALWSRAAEALTIAWPLLDARRRDEALVHLAASFARLGDETTRQGLREPLVRAVDTTESTPESTVRGAGSAGLQAALELSAAGGAPQAFGQAALTWLAPRTSDVAASALAGDSARAADLVEAWVSAVDATTSISSLRLERDARILVAIETLLRRNASMERPGVAADAAGSLLDALPWTGEPARRSRVAEAFHAWLQDPSITPLALHGLTSVLAARRPGAWWEPWLVVDARADMASRARTSEHFVTALAAASSEAPAAAARIKGVSPELVDRWSRVATAVQARAVAPDPAFRLAHAAELIALVEAMRLLERGRTSDAQARIAQVEDPTGLAPDDLDRWRDRVERPSVRAASSDGSLADELRSRRALADRVASLRMLRTRVAGDLGPLDAAVLAREALASPTPELRSVAQGVVVDAYALGPEVVGALVAEMPAAVVPGEAAQLAALVSGQPVPRGSDERLRAAAALLLLDHLATLSPSDRHRVDSVSREFALSANAVVRAIGGTAPGAASTPERAFAAWFEARVADARPLVPAATLDAVVGRANARRRLAQAGPQAFVAEASSLVELEAVLLAERSPRRRTEIDACVQRAAAARARAPDVYAQIEADARALLELARLAVEPEGSAR